MRLRYRVFVEEEKNMRMRNDEGLEKDEYDAFCEHLIVKDLDSEQIVGTYRLLPGDRALQHIGFYSETEFDLTGFHPYKAKTLELGRSCITPEYRSGKAIQLLWEGIAAYIKSLIISSWLGALAYISAAWMISTSSIRCFAAKK